MAEWQLKTPVAFLFFNRPHMTENVFQAIRDVKPPKLLLIADGPRMNVPDDAKKCAAARAVVNKVDWHCEVVSNYSDTNLGMKGREESGFDWVFGQVEEAIILEDDCLPHRSFFRYCEELLKMYRDDDRIMTIGGNNFDVGRSRRGDSYYFSRYPLTWGWATWRRAWKYYDGEMKHWPTVRSESWLKDILQDANTVRYWTDVFQRTYEGDISTWDYPWTLSCWLQNGLSIVPNVNLVSNLGFGPEATNTLSKRSPLANRPVQAVGFPLCHPPFIVRDARADYLTQRNRHNLRLQERVRQRIKKLMVDTRLVEDRPGLEERVKQEIKNSLTGWWTRS